MAITLYPLSDLPLVQPGADLAGLILDALARSDLMLDNGDLLAIAQKVVSKAEGRLVSLASVTPSEKARSLAARTGKDPRLVELILRESEEVSRVAPNVLIVRHRLGFTSANAGIDRSNVPQGEEETVVLLLPEDPDGSAAALRQKIQERTGVSVGVIITDSHGRPFRLGAVGIAIGVAGIPALWDCRGHPDLYGYELKHTKVGIADEIASAASLLMGQAAEGTPVVLIRGLLLPPGAGTGRELIRPPETDLYR